MGNKSVEGLRIKLDHEVFSNAMQSFITRFPNGFKIVDARIEMLDHNTQVGIVLKAEELTGDKEETNG